jgi:aminopeptidase N
MRRWVSEHAGDTVTTDDFLALAEDVSGQELDDLFERWLYTTGLPELPPPPG